MGVAAIPIAGAILNKTLNKPSRAGKDLSRSLFESGDIQRFLPPGLRSGITEPLIGAGIGGIGELLQRPGGLSPNVSEAILPRLSAESQNIAQQFRGMQSSQAGAAARGNMPVSIKAALDSALNVAQERAQRGARGAALTESEALRRQDLSGIYSLLDAILQFTQAGRGTATAGLAANVQARSQSQAATMALISNMLSSMGGMGGGRSGGGGGAYTPGVPTAGGYL